MDILYDEILESFRKLLSDACISILLSFVEHEEHSFITAKNIRFLFPSSKYVSMNLTNYHHNVILALLQAKDHDGFLYIDPSVKDNYAIKLASENGCTEIVRLLLKDRRVDPRADNNYSIRFASIHGCTETVRLLLEDEMIEGKRNADPSANNNFAIKWTSRNGHTETVKLLLEDERIDSSADDDTAIRWAYNNGHTEIVRMLLEDKKTKGKRVDPSAII